jgi:hypothetical protein
MENLHAENYIAQMEIRVMFITWLNIVEITQQKMKKNIWYISANRLSIYSQLPVLNRTYFQEKMSRSLQLRYRPVSLYYNWKFKIVYI